MVFCWNSFPKTSAPMVKQPIEYSGHDQISAHFDPNIVSTDADSVSPNAGSSTLISLAILGFTRLPSSLQRGHKDLLQRKPFHRHRFGGQRLYPPQHRFRLAVPRDLQLSALPFDVLYRD